MLDADSARVAEKARSHSGNRTDCGSMGGARWYAIATKHRQSHAAMMAIEDLGFRAFLPWVSFPLPNGARELRPMFGPYVFAYFDLLADPWGAITRLECLPDRPVLSIAGSPCPVPTRLINSIYADLGRRYEDVAGRLGRREKLVVDDPVAVLVAGGDEVRLLDGPFAGQCGVVERVKRGGRLGCVAIDGLQFPLWVPADRLALVSDEAPA